MEGRKILEPHLQPPAGTSEDTHKANIARIVRAFNAASGAPQLQIKKENVHKEWTKAREQDDTTPGAHRVKKGKTKVAARSPSPFSPGSTKKASASKGRKTKAAARSLSPSSPRSTKTTRKGKAKAADARSPSPSSLSADSSGDEVRDEVKEAPSPRKIVRGQEQHILSGPIELSSDDEAAAAEKETATTRRTAPTQLQHTPRVKALSMLTSHAGSQGECSAELTCVH